MPGLNRRIDPVTGDYLADGKGSYLKTTDLSTPIWHQLQGEFGRWVGDPDAGSRIYTLERRGNSQANAARLGDIVKQALKPFVDLGLAANHQAVVDRDIAGRFTLRSFIHDLQHGQLDISGLLPGGP